MQENQALPEAPADVRRLIETHRAFYDVSPHYSVLDQRPAGGVPSTRRIQIGFDIDVYAMKPADEPGSSPEYELGYGTLRQAAEMVRAEIGGACSIEAFPFRSTTILDTKNHLEPLAITRIAITHLRGLDQPFGAPEQRALKEIQEKLKGLGLKAA